MSSGNHCELAKECNDGIATSGTFQNIAPAGERQNRAPACVDKPQLPNAQENITHVHPPASTSLAIPTGLETAQLCAGAEELPLLRIELDYRFRSQRADELLPDAQDDRVVVGVRWRTVRVVASSREDPEGESEAAALPNMPNIESPMSTQAVHGSNVDVQINESTENPSEEHGSTEHDDMQSESDPADATSQMFYRRPALFLRQLLPESAWEPDDTTSVCHQCSRRFTLFLRRHHCRRCGLIFCDTCSQRRILLASPVTPAQGGYYSQQPVLSDDDLPLAHHLYAGSSRAMCWRFHEHRACDACAESVDRLPTAGTESIALVPVDSESSGAAENAYNIFRDSSFLSGEAGGPHHQRSTSGGATQMRRQQSSSSICVCPVCMRDWATVWSSMTRVPGEGWQEAQERHIRECIEDTSAEMQGGGARRRQQSDARRSRSVQGRAHDSQHVSQPVPEQPRRSVGFLSFFDRTPPRDTSSLETVHQALAAGQQRGDDTHVNTRVARSPMGVRYVSYKLTSDTPLLGQECPICFDDFEPGQRVARLNCLCTYHQPCINDWLQRTPACPVHYE